MHDVFTGRSVAASMHILNKTPIDYYSKWQTTVETTTYGSEFVAARTATEQIMDLRATVQYLGANVRERAYMSGDNESVVKSSIIPHAKLHKWYVLHVSRKILYHLFDLRLTVRLTINADKRVAII